MKLSLVERLRILALLPQEGDIITLRLVADARSLLGLSDKEISDFEVTSEENGLVKWNPAKAQDKDFTIGQALTTLIRQSLMQLNGEKRLTTEDVSIYEKFIEGGETK